LFATGNFNESTAKYYADHILLTARAAILGEVENLFLFMKKRKMFPDHKRKNFKHLLVGQFNLLQSFIALIEREITHAKKGFLVELRLKSITLKRRF
jgi:polyphosphate kinase